MKIRDEKSNSRLLQTTSSRNLSFTSSAFLSAHQSPFFSPRSENINSTGKKFRDPESSLNGRINLSKNSRNQFTSNHNDFRKFHDENDYYPGDSEKQENGYGTPSSVSLSSNQIRSYDVFISFHGRKRPLLRFMNWLRSEMEVQGMRCYVSDSARCRNSRKRESVERAMDVSAFGVVILTKKCFQNQYTIHELRFFSKRKNLVPVFFDVGPGDCLVRDIIEKHGEIWEKYGGELWSSYGGSDEEWKEAVNGVFRVEERNLEAHEGNWRDCIFRAVVFLAIRLGRRSVYERLTKWKERAEKEEFPFPRNKNFVGRKKEISELEFILFGDVTGESRNDYFELKAKSRQNNSIVHRKGKEPMVWKESEGEIEMESVDFSVTGKGIAFDSSRPQRRKRSAKISYGKGIACVSGESGIGKTELLLEFAYKFHQRYKMVLWVGGDRRYIRKNYLNLFPFLEVDIEIDNSLQKTRIKTLQEHEDDAISRIRKELMRNIPFLVVIDDLECETDWWDHKLLMDLLPRFGGETHCIISTNLPRVFNLEPLKLSYLSGVESTALMRRNFEDYPSVEIDALKVIEEKLGRSTLGLAIIGAVLTELPINPSRLLETIERMQIREGYDSLQLHNVFLLKLFELCFMIFDHADENNSLATRMVHVAGWFAPSAIPVPLLSAAAKRVPRKRNGICTWKKTLCFLTCGCASSYSKKTELEASSLLLRFHIAKHSTKQNCIYFNKLITSYARKRGVIKAPQAVVHAVINRGPDPDFSEHLWAACFLVFGFKTDPIAVDLKIPDLIILIKEVVLPLGIQTFFSLSQCGSALDLLRLCTDALESADEKFVMPVGKSICWEPIKNKAQLNPWLWQELALTRAMVLETRAKLMMKGGEFVIADDLIRKAIFVRVSINGEDHADTVAAREILSEVTRFLMNVQERNSSP